MPDSNRSGRGLPREVGRRRQEPPGLPTLNRTNKNGPLVAEGAIDLAAFYSPTGSPLQYHRRWKA